MKTTRKVRSVNLLLILGIFILTSVGIASAADPQNYGMRTIRITSKCPSFPDVPPPANTIDTNCSAVPTLVNSPSGRWSVDISWFDAETQKYYLADRNNFGIDIIDTTTDQVVGYAGGFVGTHCPTPQTTNCLPAPPGNSAGPNGVLTTSNPRQLWGGDGDGTVKVFSLDANGLNPVLIKSINAGGVRRADEMAFDPDHHLVLVAWDDDADLFLQLFSVSSNPTAVGSKISLPSASGFGIEQPVYDPASQKFYVAIPGTSTNTNGEILVIDPVTKAIVGHLALPTSGNGAACFPHGLALGPRGNLLLGCSGDGPAGTQLQSIIMKTDGTILNIFTQLGGSDEVWYNPGDNHYYLAMSSWTSTGKIGGSATPSLGIINAGTADGTAAGGPSWVQNVPTTRTSHSVAAAYAIACEDNNGNGPNKSKGKGNSNNNGNGNSNGNNGNHGNGNNGEGSECAPVYNKVYLPLTTVPTTGTPTEPGGIGVFGQIP
jgi:hypothetical protein